MIRSAKEVRRFEIVATDGGIGSVDDFYFDDERWLSADEARAIKEAQSYLREEPEPRDAGVERRSRPR